MATPRGVPSMLYSPQSSKGRGSRLGDPDAPPSTRVCQRPLSYALGVPPYCIYSPGFSPGDFLLPHACPWSVLLPAESGPSSEAQSANG